MDVDKFHSKKSQNIENRLEKALRKALEKVQLYKVSLQLMKISSRLRVFFQVRGSY